LDTYRINDAGVVCESIDDEVVIINLETGAYYSLQDPAADLWSLLESPASEDDIVEAVCDGYGADPSQVRLEVARFLEELHDEDLVVIDSNVDGATGIVRERLAKTKPFTSFQLQKFTDMTHLLMLDPVHDVDEAVGWPVRKPEAEQESQLSAPGR
jgi:Coenzyme PQQ synthesis protein D (PqqD)